MFEGPGSKESYRSSRGGSPRATSLRVANAHVLSVLVFTGCGNCPSDPDPPPPPPTADAISVYPDNIFVRPGDVFEIRTRVFDTAGEPMGETDNTLQVTVSSLGDPRISFAPDPGWPWRGTLTVQDASKFPNPLETIDMQASVPATPALRDFKIHVVRAAGMPTDDHMVTPYVSGQLPAVAIWSGKSGGETVPRTWSGFVGRAPIGSLDAGPGEAAVFSPTRRAAAGPRTWTPSQETVEFHNSATSGPPFTVLLQVWNSTGKDWDDAGDPYAKDVQQLLKDQLAAARTLYAEHRVGINFEQYGQHVQLTEVDDGILAPKAACKFPDQDAVLGQTGNEVPMDVAILHVVFVTKIYASSSSSGYSCEYSPSQTAGVILLDVNGGEASVLAHELAHQLGLRDPSGHTGTDGVGHVANIDPSGAFDAGNLMWWAPKSGKAYGRTHFTLGQVYRMNVQEWSWLNRGEDFNSSPGTPIRAGSHTLPPNWMAPCPGQASSSKHCPQLWTDIDG